VSFRREGGRGDGGAFLDPAAERGAFLRRRYRRFSVDLVVTLDGTGFDFARRHRAELWPDAPLLFCGLSEAEARSRPRPPRSAGLALADDPAETIQFALSLQPSARRLVVVDGVGASNPAIEARVQEALHRIPKRLEPDFLVAESVPALLDSLHRVSRSSIVLYALSDRDSLALGQRSRDLVQRISEAAAAPVYGFREASVGQGVVGGVASSIEDHGREAAALALKVLAGENPDSIALADTPPAARADWLQLSRWGLDEARLPADTELRNIRPKIWQSYQREVILAAVAIGILTALVLALLLWRASRRVAEDKLRKRLAFERLLSEVSASVTEEEIERPLERVVAAMDLERCGLFLVRPGQSHATISHVAQARGARSLDIGFGGEILPRLSNALSEGRAVELDESGAVKAGDADAEPPQVVLVPVSREGDAISGIFFQAGGGHATLP